MHHLQQTSRTKEEELQSCVTTYLEQEVRAEAIVRNLAAYARFLELACAESGRLVSFRKLSQGVDALPWQQVESIVETT